jgi:hypothetical protein
MMKYVAYVVLLSFALLLIWPADTFATRVDYNEPYFDDWDDDPAMSQGTAYVVAAVVAVVLVGIIYYVRAHKSKPASEPPTLSDTKEFPTENSDTQQQYNESLNDADR